MMIFSYVGALDNKGKEFMISFLDNLARPTDYPMDIFVTTHSNQPVTVNVMGPNANTTNKISETFTVRQGEVHLVSAHQDYRLHGTEFSSKGISLTANHDIEVYGLNKEKLSADGYLAIPTDAIG